MGDVSIIARRIGDKIQFGWSGNGGTPRSVGKNLVYYYNTTEKVEKLFELGQLWNLGLPDDIALKIQKEIDGENASGNIEDVPRTYRNIPANPDKFTPHWITDKDMGIYSKIAFIDHVYFWESDNRWYYITPLKNIKVPLELIVHFRLHDYWELIEEIDEEESDKFNIYELKEWRLKQ